MESFFPFYNGNQPQPINSISVLSTNLTQEKPKKTSTLQIMNLNKSMTIVDNKHNNHF